MIRRENSKESGLEVNSEGTGAQTGEESRSNRQDAVMSKN